MIRACILPNEEFSQIDNNVIQIACEKFYQLYEILYGQVNCTYSVHVVPSHLLQVRGDKPLTYKSAFKFESFFSEMRQLYHPGSISTPKQILQNCYIKRLLEHHQCEKTIFYSPQKNPNVKENNSLIYTFKDGKITMYSIIEIIDHNSFNCNIQGKFQANFSVTPEYNWNQVGVFKLGPISEECYVVHRNAISGKVLKVGVTLLHVQKMSYWNNKNC